MCISLIVAGSDGLNRCPLKGLRIDYLTTTILIVAITDYITRPLLMRRYCNYLHFIYTIILTL